MKWIGVAGLAAACSGGEVPTIPLGPCEQAAVEVEVAPPYGDYGALGLDALWCGNPPQGGAPYSPFRLRVAGPESLGEGIEVEMTATDLDTGELLGETSLTMGLTCANVGESAGLWVGAEAHLRYEGQALDALGGRTAELVFRVTALDDPSATGELRATAELTTVLP